jgi:hypothetical protein
LGGGNHELGRASKGELELIAEGAEELREIGERTSCN